LQRLLFVAFLTSLIHSRNLYQLAVVQLATRFDCGQLIEDVHIVVICNFDGRRIMGSFSSKTLVNC